MTLTPPDSGHSPSPTRALNTLKSPREGKTLESRATEIPVRKADIQKQGETSHVALEASDEAPESREGDCVPVHVREGED